MLIERIHGGTELRDGLPGGEMPTGSAANQGAPITGPELADRLTALELSIISHPSHSHALAELERLLARGRMIRAGRRLKAKACLVYGSAGSGKTTLIEDFANRHPDTHRDDGDVRRVIVVEMPESTTKKALVRAILEEMGYRPGSNQSAASIIKDIADKVSRLGVEMIIIDEGHHIISGNAVLAVSEFLKSLLNRVKCQIVIVGLEDLRIMHGFAQFDRRLMPDIPLESYDWTCQAGRLEFLALLRSFENLLDLPQKSCLAEQDFAMRLYVATGGRIGIISKYLSRALELAVERNLPKVTKALLAEIYASWHPEAKVPARVDFCAKLEIPKKATSEVLAELAAKLRAIRIDPESNPFVCSAAKCADLWALRTNGREDEVKPARRIRGSGPKPVQAFAK